MTNNRTRAAAGPAAAAAAEPVASSPETFEAAVAELDGIVTRMEEGSLSLEQSLAAYKRGAELVQYCQKTLADVQQQVKILEAGLFKPFDGVAGALDDEDVS